MKKRPRTTLRLRVAAAVAAATGLTCTALAALPASAATDCHKTPNSASTRLLPAPDVDGGVLGPDQTLSWLKLPKTMQGGQVPGLGAAPQMGGRNAAQQHVGRDNGTPGTPRSGASLFDDFNYSGHNDPRITEHGWTVKSGSSGPGNLASVWAPQNVTFANQDGNSVMNLETSTDGTYPGTRESEIYHKRKFKNGTYAARVRFSDAPRTGPDGDQVVQTFFTITPLAYDNDPNYGELDFEYRPNGGWGETGNILSTTSWETYQSYPWQPAYTHTDSRASYAGWHDLMITVDDAHIRYYVDGRLFAIHGQPYLPETPMSIHFNQWMIDGGLAKGRAHREYDEKVDYVYFAKDRILTPDQVRAQVQSYRSDGVHFEDTVPTT
jgi:Glycosyl hydrolases family 16